MENNMTMNCWEMINDIGCLQRMVIGITILLAVVIFILAMVIKADDDLASKYMVLQRDLEEEKNKNKLLTEDNQRLSDECWDIYERYGDVVDMCNDLRTKLGEKMLEEKKVEQ